MAYLIGILCLLPVSAFAEPVSLIVGGLSAWGTAAAVSAGVISATVLGMSTVALAFSVSQAVYGAAKARRQQKKAARAARDAYNAGLEDRTTTVLQSNPPARVIYGTATVTGSPVAIFTSGDKDQFKHVVIEWAHHECEAILDFQIAGQSLGKLDANGSPTSGKYVKVNTTNGFFSGTTNLLGQLDISIPDAQLIGAATESIDAAPHVVSGTLVNGIFSGSFPNTLITIQYTRQTSNSYINIKTYLGSASQNADAGLMAAVPDKWTANHRLRGRCYSIVTLDLTEPEFQGGFPQLTATIKGKKVFDPRSSTTYWTDNAALCISDYIISPLGKDAPYSSIIESDLIASANICDELLTPIGGQAYKRYTINGSFVSTDEPLEAMAQAMAGYVSCPGGWSIMAGAYTPPVMTINDQDFLGGFEIVNSVSRAELFNGVTGQYFDVANPTVQVEFKPYTNSAYVTADGDELFTDISYPFTNEAKRVEQLNRIAVEDHRQAMTIKCSIGMKGWDLRVGQRVTVNNTLHSISNKVFRVMSWGLGVQTPVSLLLKEDAIGIWDAADDQSYDQAPNNNQPDVWVIDKPVLKTPESGTAHLIISNDGTVFSRIYLQYEPSNNITVTEGGKIEIQFKLTGQDFVSIAPAAGNSSFTYISNVEDGGIYTIRARWCNTVACSDWTYISHQVIGKTEPPPNVVNFTINNLLLEWSPVSAIDLAGYEIRHNAGQNTWWDGAQKLHEGILTDSPYKIEKVLSGQITFLIRAIDRSGNYSDQSAIIRTDLGDQLVNNILVSYPQAPNWTGTKTNCTVSSGTLIANATDLFYGADDEAFYGQDSLLFYPASTYAELSYECSITLNSAGTLLLDEAIQGTNHTIEYSRFNGNLFYEIDNDLFYGADGDPFYNVPLPWTTWPGALQISASEEISFRVKIAEGSQQGILSVFTPFLDVPDIDEKLNDVVISASGTRLPITKTYRVIKNVLLTLQSDGNGGESVEIIDKNAKFGPLIRVKSAGNAVQGLVDGQIQGY
jgi:hypothetical protein